MWTIPTHSVTSVICVFVCVLGTLVNCAKTGEPIEVPFWGQTRMGRIDRIGATWRVRFNDSARRRLRAAAIIAAETCLKFMHFAGTTRVGIAEGVGV